MNDSSHLSLLLIIRQVKDCQKKYWTQNFISFYLHQYLSKLLLIKHSKQYSRRKASQFDLELFHLFELSIPNFLSFFESFDWQKPKGVIGKKDQYLVIPLSQFGYKLPTASLS